MAVRNLGNHPVSTCHIINNLSGPKLYSQLTLFNKHLLGTYCIRSVSLCWERQRWKMFGVEDVLSRRFRGKEFKTSRFHVGDS